LQIQTTREDHRIAWLAALAVAIHVAEAVLPSPLPGIKPGLANVVTVVALLRYGWRAAAWISGLRVLAGSLITGTFLSPTFLLSASGSLCALLVLALVHALQADRPTERLVLSAVGLSVIAALAHMGGQFLVAWYLLIPHPALLKLLPVFMSFALAFGILSGTIACGVIARLNADPADHPSDDVTPQRDQT
jgi:heptaprenyl diphosphate synthase